MKISSLFHGADLLDEHRARKNILDLLHPGGPGCPFCGELLPQDPGRLKRFYDLEVCYCGACKRKYYATSRSPFKTLRIPWQEACLIMCLFEEGMKAGQIKRLLRRNAQTIRDVKRRFKILLEAYL